jgi:hypothetical protein
MPPWRLATDQRGPGFARISSAAVDIGAVEVDAILPTVQSSEFNYITGPQSLRYTFSELVNLTKSALLLENRTTLQTIPLNNFSLSFNSHTKTAIFTFPSYAGGILPDGDYRATLDRNLVADFSNNHPASNHLSNFFFLLGDLNHDRAVTIADFITLGSDFGKPAQLIPTAI